MEAIKIKPSRPVHFVLVHGACHGAWCWFKVKPLLEAASHRVTALDMAASGVNSSRLQDLRSIEDYTQPLLDLLGSLPPSEKVILVGHSYGGINLAVAMDRYPNKISIAIFVAALMPDFEHKPSYVLDKFLESNPIEAWLDTEFALFDTPEGPLTSMLCGPEFTSTKLYSLCSPEDVALANMLLRPVCIFVDDLSRKEPFSRATYGSVKRAYIVCVKDMVVSVSLQHWQVDNIGADEVLEITDADHMPMLSTPHKLCQLLIQIVGHHT